MLIRRGVLALGAIFGGVLNLPEGIKGGARLSGFLDPIVGKGNEKEAIGVVLVMWALAAGAVIAAWLIYGTADLERRAAVRRRLGPVNTLVRQKFFVDEIYATIIVAPVRLAALFAAG